jgi:hypothetical protein
VKQWKRQLLEGASELFGRGKKSKDKNEAEGFETELCQQFGRLQMELECLKKDSAFVIPMNCVSWPITPIQSADTLNHPCPKGRVDGLIESAKAHFRAKVEHPFRVIKQHFGFQKTEVGARHALAKAADRTCRSH